MERESFILYTSFYEPLKYLSDSQMGKLFKAIFEYQINGNTDVENEIRIAFEFIKNQLDIDAEKWKDEKQKRSDAGKKGMAKRWKKDSNVITEDNKNNSVINSITNITDNVNENVNVNVNDNVNVIDNSDSCVDGFLQSDSCVDEIVKFYEQNYGTISPFIYETLNDYRADFSDDIIIYALQLGVEVNAKNIKYVKAILKNWRNANVKSLLDAQNENKKKNSKDIKNIHRTEDTQFSDLSKFYIN